MGKTILTAKQLDFLECTLTQPSLLKRFYWTGGTALAEIYLQHRLSEDIDLFTETEEVDQKLVEAFIKQASTKLGVKQIKRSQFLGLISFLLIYYDDDMLKVDFNYYPFPRINKGKKYKDLEVDSIYDIAVNKVHTLFMKPRTRDYIDLFFIMQKGDYSLEKLIMDAKAKFDWDIDRVSLASQFIRVKELRQDEFPKMFVPFDKKDMEKFFLDLAKSLENNIFK